MTIPPCKPLQPYIERETQAVEISHRRRRRVFIRVEVNGARAERSLDLAEPGIAWHFHHMVEVRFLLLELHKLHAAQIQIVSDAFVVQHFSSQNQCVRFWLKCNRVVCIEALTMEIAASATRKDTAYTKPLCLEKRPGCRIHEIAGEMMNTW